MVRDRIKPSACQKLENLFHQRGMAKHEPVFTANTFAPPASLACVDFFFAEDTGNKCGFAVNRGFFEFSGHVAHASNKRLQLLNL